MQTTLLGLAIAIILALVSALVAPLVVDWNQLPLGVRGGGEPADRPDGARQRRDRRAHSADVRASSCATSRSARPAGEPQVRAGTVELELGLGPLLRGEVRATELRLVSPQISLGLDRSGAIDWPAPSSSFRSGRAHHIAAQCRGRPRHSRDAASGSRLTLQKLSFNGDIRSFLGPFSGEGAFVVGDEPYGYRISGSRVRRGRRSQAAARHRSVQSSADHRDRRHAQLRSRRPAIRRHAWRWRGRSESRSRAASG